MSNKPAPGFEVDPLRDPAESEVDTAVAEAEQALPPSFVSHMAQQMDHKPSSV